MAKIPCPQCDKTFRGESGLNWHLEHSHGGAEKMEPQSPDLKALDDKLERYFGAVSLAIVATSPEETFLSCPHCEGEFVYTEALEVDSQVWVGFLTCKDCGYETWHPPIEPSSIQRPSKTT